ncbi:nitroreductase/quinone reductase family protein [Paractinoplanes lichenicola]|uniref:Nitroreductase family deazaflavin-dependent oxidoreductase n=1 Tax=Paractinoplanes lichenicola TaxID=2802976 RepID=A0ABS1VUV2_9ACTN|nr:nitroreductase/quinone reductase family protein [Actinoplanes lichenicola]MBL7258257.1 nitroreductase family deazaflavin-dependent oxidoreductase [Actinoplanes lichenicola]
MAVRVPPRWVVRTAWAIHRGIYRVSGGRVGLSKPKPAKYGTLRLTTTGRRSGQPRSVLLAYYEDGPDLVLMSMNGWGEGHPAWWLNLRAQPDAIAEVDGVRREVRGRRTDSDERARLWERWHVYDKRLDEWAALRDTEAVVIVLEPRPA